MKRIFYLTLIWLLSSCMSEKNAEPGKPATFVRYFNGGNDDVAQVAEETSDNGIIILGTTRVNNDKLTTNKIKLIKTDQYGNVEWQNVYPSAFTAAVENITASSLLQLASGNFLVIGTITLPLRTAMYLLEIDATGKVVNQKTIDFDPAIVGPLLSVQGRAIQLNSDGNYLVLGGVSGDTDNIILAELDKSSLAPLQVRKYGTGASVLSNKIYLDAADNIVWSGTVTTASSDIRFAKVVKGSWGAIDDRPLGKSDLQEMGNDICRYGYGFAIAGSTNENGDQDSLLKIITGDGIELLSKSIPASGDTD